MTISSDSYAMLAEIKRECGLDKSCPDNAEPEIDEVVVRERARPLGSLKKTDKPRLRKTDPRSLPREGEVQLKQWVTEEAQRSGLSCGCVYDRLREGRYPVTLRTVHARLVWVKEIL